MNDKKLKAVEKSGEILAEFHNPKPQKKRGRKPKTLRNLPKGWKEMVLEEMSQGASLEEIKASLNLVDDTYYRFMKQYPMFSGIIEEGKRLSKAWWLKTGRKQLFNKDFSYTGWYMNMKNRFGWTDKQEQTHVIDVPTRITIKKEDKVIELLPPQKALPGGGDEY